MMRTPTASQTVVQLDGVTAGYGAHAVLRDVSFALDAGELIGVVGPSGVGKTTLLRLIAGEVDVLSGTLEVLGQRPRRRRPVRGVGYVPQLDQVDWTFPLTVEQVVMLGAGAPVRQPWFSPGERRTAMDMLERLGIAELARQPIAELSGGQRQRMFVARALVHGAELILLDEPTSDVDVATRRDVLAVVRGLVRDGRTVILTTHDLNHVAVHLPRVVCFDGTVVADGAPAQVLTPEVLGRTYGAEMRIVQVAGGLAVVEGDGSVPTDEPLVGAAPDLAAAHASGVVGLR